MFKNLKHYARELIAGNAFFDEKLIYKYSILGLGALHLINGVLFFFGSLLSLSLVNIAISALVFTTILSIDPQEKADLIHVYVILLLELMIVTFVEVTMLGWNCGLGTYYFAAVASTFYYSYMTTAKNGLRHSMPLVLSLLVILCYLFNYALMQFIPPILPMESAFWAQVIFVFNTIAGFGIIIIFSYLFIWEIHHKNNILTKQNALLDELANKDPLTKLYNRRSMNEFMDARMEQLKKTGKRFTMVLADIDDFKKVNDTYGHDAGDLVLVKVAEIITSNVEEGDSICRWGGEEILILLNDPLEMASIKAEKIRKAIETTVIKFEDKDIHVTMTFGITESVPGYRIEHLIQQADDKLYYGKKHGKNQVVVDLRPL